MRVAPSTMVSHEELAKAVESLLGESNSKVSSFDNIVRELQLKLGLDDLSHKAEFLGNHIQLLLCPQPPREFLHQLHLPSQDLASRTQQVPPVTKTNAVSSTNTDVAAPVAILAKPAKNAKQSAEKGKNRRGGPGGLNKLCGVSPLLQPIVGNSRLTRLEIVQQLWTYIRKNNLQDPSNKRSRICKD